VSRGIRMRREFALSSAGLGAAFDFIRETVARRGGDDTVARRLSIIVDEICGNLIRHDGSLTEAHRFTLELTDDGDATVLVICDPGKPFNPTGRRPAGARTGDRRPDRAAGIGAAGIGGFGLDLVRGLSSRVRYERAGECNRLTVSIAADG
jgi:anti-sigma regulatory factor (Ser/Thr protein kinase)